MIADSRPVLAMGLLILASACGSDPAPPPAPLTAPAFVSTAPVEARCAECHADLAEAYAESAMARALGPVSLEELAPLASTPGATSPAGWTYGLFLNPEGNLFGVGETHADFPEHRFGAATEFAIGAGVRDRSLAVRHGAGLHFAPVEILTDRANGGARHLALSPGESIRPGMRFGIALTAECLGCHTSQPLPPTYPAHHIAPNKMPNTGVGCAGCHGSQAQLSAHITYQEAALSGADGDGEPLLNIASAPRHTRMSICAACHLQGDARIVLANQSMGQFTPGGDLSAERATFVAAEPTNEVGFVSQTERLVLSTCYTQSEMDCTTCHDPHRALQGVTRALGRQQELTRRACLDCHGLAACVRPPDMPLPPSADATLDPALNCVACHMPETPVFDVHQVTIRDHFIRRNPKVAEPSDALRVSESPTGDWKRFRFPGEPATEPRDELGLWMMAYAGGGLHARAAELVDAPPGPEAERLAMYHHVRGTLLDALGRTEGARAAYERALEIDPLLGPAATNLGLVLLQLEEPEAALALFDAHLKRYPLAEGALRNRALVQRALGRFAAFRSDLERAFTINPTGELARVLAASFKANEPTPDLQRAEVYSRMAQELDPQ